MANEVFQEIILILCIFILLELFSMFEIIYFYLKTPKLIKMKMWKYQFIKGQFDEVLSFILRLSISILYIPKTSSLSDLNTPI